MRLSLAPRLGAALLFAALASCGSNPDGNGDDQNGDGGAGGDAGPCQGLACFQVDCAGGGTTSISGTVFAPNGTLPLYNVNVYVPTSAVGALPDGLTCDRCGGALLGNPLVQTTTDTEGHFVLPDMPATTDVPLVIQVGKWRRQIVLPAVPECVDTATVPALTRLPRNQTEGDIPDMALTTGGADALECLLRKIGLDDSEFSIAGGPGKVDLYAGGLSGNNSDGTDQFDGALGGGVFTNATTLWDDTPSLSAYDVVLLSCEGDQNPSTKGAPSLQAMKDYADAGGRVFASHWHNIWLQQGPAPWAAAFTFDVENDALDDITADVNVDFDRGAALAQWLVNVEASTILGKIDLTESKNTLVSVDESKIDKWIYLDDNPVNNEASVQYMSFTVPLEDPTADRCGRVVFSDIHVSGDDNSADNLTFPSGGCVSDVATLSPQEKVLAFMIFDIASCVGPVVE